MAQSPLLSNVKVRWCLAAAGVFAIGCAGGFVGARLHAIGSIDGAEEIAASAPLPRSEQVQSPSIATAANAVANASIEPPAARPEPDTESRDALVERLDDERTERERLDSELQQVRATLVALERRLETVNAANVAQVDAAGEREADAGRSRHVDADRLVDAGFDVDDATFIAQRWGEQQMALLRLRDRAQREGWIGEERYEEAERSVRRGENSLRGLLDEAEYDRFLFGTGRTNRVRVEQVIEGSPAQQLGLGPDDVLLRYDDAPVYSYEDLRSAITSDEVDETATLEVERDGRLIEFEVPRGPIGVQLRGVAVEP